ncbi:hypothetical protein FEM41_05380 [Jejubacter calystegiae]|uniref:High mobility group protein Z n=1 Tax=Jejubacter calystegiae TaxID=2579935 RepID=A0A4V1G7C1_9ENTR|nr:hypothetical protein FEM41_05380 [Jejubacter calystegiae]
MGPLVLIIVLPIACYLLWLFVKLQRLSRRQRWLRNRMMARGSGGASYPGRAGRRLRRRRKE